MDFVNRWLKQNREAGKYRHLTPLERLTDGLVREAGKDSDRIIKDFSSNDYLALSIHSWFMPTPPVAPVVAR